jgi:membrane protease YdiL (CAAX protease family)
MDVLQDARFGGAVLVLGGTLAVASAMIPVFRAALAWLRRRADARDLLAVAALYLVVVGLLRLGFGGFTTDRMLWFFLTFAAALLLGVGGPVFYQVRIRGGSLEDLGIGTQRWKSTFVLGLVFASVQFSITLWGYDLPGTRAWATLLGMALMVGVFESIFFRGFVQGRLQASFGAAPAVFGAALLYGLYHVGYGMGLEESLFLGGLGIVYALAYLTTENVLILWPLLTPLGSWFAQLEDGELLDRLPWASLLGFADVVAVMGALIWFAHRHERKLLAR